MNSSNPQPTTATLLNSDRRRHARYTVQVPIEILILDSGAPMHCETSDLSQGGCYIRLAVPLPVGIRLHATLWLDGHPIVIRGLIVTRHPEFGNGIMFADFEGQGEEEALLKRYLEGLTT
ncbi:MAG: PilZ domain-containing protein [Terriglobales bacterium]